MEAARKFRQPANDFFGAFPYPISMGGFHSSEELSIGERSFNACGCVKARVSEFAFVSCTHIVMYH